VGLPTAEKIVKLRVSKARFLFLPRGLRLDPKGISVSWNAFLLNKTIIDEESSNCKNVCR